MVLQPTSLLMWSLWILILAPFVTGSTRPKTAESIPCLGTTKYQSSDVTIGAFVVYNHIPAHTLAHSSAQLAKKTTTFLFAHNVLMNIAASMVHLVGPDLSHEVVPLQGGQHPMLNETQLLEIALILVPLLPLALPLVKIVINELGKSLARLQLLIHVDQLLAHDHLGHLLARRDHNHDHLHGRQLVLHHVPPHDRRHAHRLDQHHQLALIQL